MYKCRVKLRKVEKFKKLGVSLFRKIVLFVNVSILFIYFKCVIRKCEFKVCLVL